MVNPQDPNRRFYFKKLDPLSRQNFLKYLNEKKREVYLWVKGYEEKDLEAFQITHVNKNGSHLDLEKNTHFLKKVFKSLLTDNDVFIKVIKGNDYYFFQGHLTHKKKSNYSLSIKDEVYVGERRKNYRLSSSVFIRINIQMENKLFSGHDISAGGCSFIIPEDLEPDWSVNKLLKNSIISINRDKFIIPKSKIIKKSKFVQFTSLSNCSIALITIGPLQIVAASSGTK